MLFSNVVRLFTNHGFPEATTWSCARKAAKRLTQINKHEVFRRKIGSGDL